MQNTQGWITRQERELLDTMSLWHEETVRDEVRRWKKGKPETHVLKVRSWEVYKRPNTTMMIAVWCRCDWMAQGKRQQVAKAIMEHLLGKE